MGVWRRRGVISEVVEELEGLGRGRQAAGDLIEKAWRRGRRRRVGEEELIELSCVPFIFWRLKEL